MKIKLDCKLFFSAALLFDLVVLISLLIKPLSIRSYAEKNNKILRLECSLYDPFDPMKGRYVSLTFEETKGMLFDLMIDESILKNTEDDKFKYDFPLVYAVFENDEKGISRLKEITLERPEELKLFIRVPAHYYRNTDEFVLDVDFDRYYLQEEYADKLDHMSASRFKELNPVLELWVGKNGDAIQKDLVLSD